MPADARGRRGRLRRGTVIRVGLVVLVLVSLAATVAARWDDLPEVDWRFRPGWLAVCVLAMAAFQTMHAELWTRMMGALGWPIEPWRSRAIWNVTLLGRYVPTSALMAVGRIDMSERAGVPKRVSLASIFYELGLQVAGALAVGAYFVVALPDLEGHAWRWLVVAVPVLALVALQPAIFHRLADWALARLGREPLPLALPRRAVGLYAVGYAASFVVAGFAVLGVAQSLHPVDAGDVPTVVGAYSVGFVAGLVAFVLPGGLGAREAALASALSPVLSITLAIAVAVAVRLVQVAVELAYASVSLLLARALSPPETARPAPPSP